MLLILWPSGRNKRVKGAMKLRELWYDGETFETSTGERWTKNMVVSARVILRSIDGWSRAIIKEPKTENVKRNNTEI